MTTAPVPLDGEIEFELHGQRCRVVCVDGIVPRQTQAQDSGRTRHLYMTHELVHFSLGGRRYALVPSRCSGGEAAECEPPEGGGRDPRHLLTAREMQIVQLICMGLLTKQVADRLHLSEFTVRSYLKTIYCKLGVRSRGGMVYAFTKVFGLSGATMAKAGESA